MMLANALQLRDALEQQSSHDVDPPLSPAAQYMQEEMSLEGYRHLLAVGVCTRCMSDSPGYLSVLVTLRLGPMLGGLCL